MPNPFDQFDGGGNPFDKFDGEPTKPSFFANAGDAAKELLHVPAETARTIGRIGVANPVSMAADHVVANLRTLMGHPTTANDLQDQGFKAVDNLVDPSIFEADRSKMGAGSRFLATGANVVGALPEIVASAPAFLANSAMTPATHAIDQGKDLPTAMELGGANLAVNAAGLKLPATAVPLLQKMGVSITSDLGATLARVLSGAAIQPPVGIAGQTADKVILDANGYPEDAAQIHPLDPESLTHAALLGGAFGLKDAIEAPRMEPARPHPDEPATPAPPSPEATAPPPERAEPAPPESPAAGILAALTGTTPPVSSVAPVRDFTSNVRTSQWAKPPEPAPAVVAPDGHPAPEDSLESLIHPDVKAGDGLETKPLLGSTGKKGGPVRALSFRPTHDDLRTYIAANGGISPEAAAELGIDPKMGRALRPGVANARPIAPGGMDVTTLQERMAEDGWLPHEDGSAPSERDVRNMVFDAVHRGERITHPDNTDHVRARQAEEADAHAADEALAQQQRTTVPDLYAKGDRADAIASGDHYNEVERPDHEPPIEGEIRLLRAKREGGHITPDETHHLIDLMDVDARTAKLAGGMRLHGVGNMLAEGEAPQPARKAFGDLDNFKAVNDTFGHAAGDQAIAQAAELLRQAFPDGVFHRGGDEFVVHGNSDTHLQDGLNAARDALAQSQIDVITPDGRQETIPGVGLSYGVGEHVDAAEAGLQADKQARAAAGLRHDRRATDSGGSAPAGRGPGEPENPAATGAGIVREGEGSDGQARAASTGPAGNGVADSSVPGAAPEAVGEPAEGVTAAPSDVTSGKNAVTEAEAIRDGIEPAESLKQPTHEAAMQHARDLAASDHAAGRKLTGSLLANPRPISAKEDAVLLHDRVRIHNELGHARAAVKDTEGKTTAQQGADVARLLDLEQQRRDNDVAFRQSGSENSAGLSARRMMAKSDYTLETLVSRAELAEGKALPAEVTKQLEELAATIADLHAKLAEKQKGEAAARVKAPKKTVDEKMQERMRADIKALEDRIKQRLSACPV